MATNTNTDDQLVVQESEEKVSNDDKFAHVSLKDIRSKEESSSTEQIIDDAEKGIVNQQDKPKKEDSFKHVSLKSIKGISEDASKDIYVESSRTIGGFNPDDYARELGTVYYNGAIDKSRALLQTTGDQLKNAAGRIFIGGAADILSNFASITDSSGYMIGEGDVVGNEFSRWAQDLSKDATDAFPIYRVNPGESFDVGDAAWWIDNGSGVVRSAGAFLATGWGVGTALGLLGKVGQAMGATKNMMNAYSKVSTLANAVALNQAESMLDAVDVYDKVYNDYLEAGLSKEDSRIKASSAASHVVNTNRMNIALNLTSASMFTKAPMMSRRVFSRNWGGRILGESAQEYMEEVVNFAASTRGTAAGYGLEKGIGSSIVDAFFSKEGAEAGFWGAVGGAVQTGGSIALDADGTRKNAGLQQQYIQQFDQDRSNIKESSMFGVGLSMDVMGDVLTNMNNAYDNIQVSIDKGESPSPVDVANYERGRTELLMAQSYSAFSIGAAENLRTYYEGIANLKPGEVGESLGEQYLDSSISAQDMAKKALEKIQIYEDIYNGVADVKYDKDKAFQSKVAIDHIKDVERTFFESTNAAMNDLQENIVDPYFKAKGQDVTDIDQSEEGLAELEKTDPELVAKIRASSQWKQIQAGENASKFLAESKIKHFEAYEKIVSEEYQKKGGEKKEAEGTGDDITVEEATKRINTLLQADNPSAKDLNLALADIASFPDLTPESLAAVTKQVNDKIAAVAAKNQASFNEQEGGTDINPDPNEDNPSGKESPDASEFAASLSEEQLAQRKALVDEFQNVISIDNPDIDNTMKALKNMADSGVFHPEEISATEEQMRAYYANDQTQDETEALKDNIIEKFLNGLEEDMLPISIIEEQIEEIIALGIFNKTEIKKLIEAANDHIIAREKEGSEQENDLADQIEEMLGDPAPESNLTEQIDKIVAEETKGLSEKSKETVASATILNGEVVPDKQADAVISEVESRNKSKTNSKIVEAIKAIRDKLRKILAAILIVAGTYFGVQSMPDTSMLNDSMANATHTEFVEAAVDNDIGDDTIPFDQHEAGGSLLLALAGLVRRNKKKQFVNNIKKHYPDANPEAVWKEMRQKHEEAEAKPPKRIPVAKMLKKMPIKRNVDQIKKDLMGKVSEFGLEASFQKKLNELVTLAEQGQLPVGQSIEIGSTKDSDGNYVGKLSAAIQQDGSASITMAELDKNGQTVRTIPIEQMPVEEFIERAKLGYIASDASMNKIRFEGDLITEKEKSIEELEEEGLDPEVVVRESDPERNSLERDITDEKKEQKELAVDKEIVEDNIKNEPDSETPVAEVDGVEVEGQESDTFDQKAQNRIDNAHFPKSYGGHVMGAKNLTSGYWEALYDENGSLVEAEYIEGNTFASTFDRLYTTDPVYGHTGGMFFLGKEARDNFRKTGDKSQAYYKKKRKADAPATAMATEVFMTNESGALLINTPEVKIGDKVTLVTPPESWKWFTTDLSAGPMTPEQAQTTPILVYRAEDVSKDGTVKEGALPLDMLSTMYNTPNEAMRALRSAFFKSDRPITLKIENKDGGYNNYNRSGDLSGGFYNLSTKEGAYERQKDGTSKWVPKDKLKRSTPIVGIIRSDGSVDIPEGSDISYAEQMGIDESGIYFAASDKNSKNAGKPVMLIPNANGTFRYSSLMQRRLDDSEKEYVMRNMSSLLMKEMDARRLYKKEHDKNLRGIDANYVEGLSEVVPTNHISTARRIDLIPGENGFDALYKEGAINFTKTSIVIRQKSGNYMEIPFRPRPSKNPRVTALLPSPIDMIMEGPALEYKDMYNPVDGTPVEMTAWIEELPNEKPMYQRTNRDGLALSRSEREILPEKKFIGFGPELAAVIRQNFFDKFDEIRRNTLIKDGERNILNDEKTPYVDPVTPDVTYDSYMDFLDQKGVLRHDVNPNNPTNGSIVYMQTIDDQFKPAASTIEAPVATTTAQAENDIKFTDPLPDTSPQDQSEKTGTLPEQIDIEEATQLEEASDAQKDLQAKLKELDPGSKVAKIIQKNGWKMSNPNDAKRIALMMRNLDRSVDEGELASGNFKSISTYEKNWLLDNFDDKVSIARTVDHVKSQGKAAWGYYFNGLAVVAGGAKEGTAYHEAFHLVFDIGLNARQKEGLLTEATKKYAGREKRYGDKNIGLEEFMADDFMDYMLKIESGEEVPRSKMKMFFDSIIYQIKNFFRMRNSMEDVFRHMEYGGFKSKLKGSNSWKRAVPMDRQIIKYNDQEVAVGYLKSNISMILKQVQFGIEANKDVKGHTGPKDLDSWIRQYSRNLFDKLIKFEDGEAVDGKIVKDLETLEDRMNSDEYFSLEEGEQQRVAKMLYILTETKDNWKSDKDSLGNSRSGFESYVASLLNSAGIPVKLGEIKMAGKKSGEEGGTKEGDGDFENNEAFGNQSSEESNDRIHDRAIYFQDTKASLDKRVKSWLFFTPVYQFDNNGVVRMTKGSTEKNYKPTKKVDIDPYTHAPRTINFDRVYNKLKNLLANKTFKKMKETMQSMSNVDDEIASIWEDIRASQETNSNIYESFFSHFHMDKKNMIMILDEGFGRFKIIDSNAATLERQLANQWKANAPFYSPSVELDTVINKQTAQKIYNHASSFRNWYNGQALTREAKERLKDEKHQKDLIEVMIKKGDHLMRSMGIEIDPMIWDDIEKKNFTYAHSKLSQMFFGKVTKSTDKEKGKATKEDSVFGLALALTQGVDIYVDKGTTIKSLTEFVRNSVLDMGSTSFIDVNGKTIYSVNMNNYLSLTITDMKGDEYEKTVEEFKQDDFYNNNLFLDALSNPEFRNRLNVYYLDGMRDSFTKTGNDYSSSSIAQSIQTRISAFFHASGDYTLINSGTKADKSQSTYTKVIKLSKVKPGMSYRDVAVETLRNTIDQERSRIALVKEWKNKGPKWVEDYGIKNILTYENGKYKGTGDRFNYIPALNAHENMTAFGDDVDTFSKNDPKLLEREKIANQEIENLLDMVVDQGLKEMYDNGVIGIDEQTGEYISIDRTTPAALGSNPRANATEFLINEFIWNLEMNKVFMGDLSAYKYAEKDGNHVVDYMKRSYQLITPGKSPVITSANETDAIYDAAIIEDVIKINDFDSVLGYARYIDHTVKESYVRKLYDQKAKNPKKSLSIPRSLNLSNPKQRRQADVISAVDNFYDANKTDAQTYSNIEWYKSIMENSQEWDNSYDFMYNKYWKDDAEIFKIMADENRNTFTEQELQEIADGPKIEPLKPFYYGSRWSDIHGKMIHEQDKNSVFVVTRLMAETFDQLPEGEGYNYRNLYKTLTGEDKKVKWANNKRQILHDSAVKVGAYGIADYSADKDFVSRPRRMSNLRFPQVINSHEELIINAGAQFPKVTGDNVKDDYIGYQAEGIAGHMTGYEVKSLLSAVWNEKVMKSKKSLSDDLGLNEDFDMPETSEGMIKFLGKVRDILRRSAIDRDTPDNQIEALDLVEDITTKLIKFKLPLDFPSIGNRYENLIATLFRNNVLKTKLHGDSMAQLADFGTEHSEELKFLRRENGEIMAAEIGVSARILRKIIGIDMPIGKIDESKLSEDQKKALLMIGYRIPTQSKSSMLPLKVTRILPDTYGASIQVPAEISVQQGSDYDIDKMFLIMRNFNEKSGELVQPNDPMDTGVYKEGINSKKQLDNLIFNLTWGIINSENNNGEVFSPLDSKSFKEIKEYYESTVEGKPLEHNRINGEKTLFNANRPQHVAAFHTNILSESLNKFAKIAVGIIGLASTGKSYYTDIKAQIRLKKDKKTGEETTKDAVFISMGGDDKARSKFVDINDDGKLTTDVLKGFGNAALDNAKDPYLGYLDINMTTINPALLMNALGYNEKVIFDFMKQPIVRELSTFFDNFNSPDIGFAANVMVADLTPAMKDAYKLAAKKYKDGTIATKIKAKDLESYLGEPINETSKSDFINAQAEILVAFINMYYKGSSLSALHKRLSPEKQSKLNGHAQLAAFDAVSKQAINHLQYENFTNAKRYSPTSRISAFYNTINTYRRFAKNLFSSYSKSFGNTRTLMSGLTTAKKTKPGHFNSMTGATNYMMLAGYSEGFKDLIGDSTQVKDLFFSEDGKALADTLVEMKNDPKYMTKELVASLDISFRNDYRFLKQITFNNSTARSVGEKNAIQESWSEMLQSKDPKARNFAEKLIPFFIISSGLDMNFNTAHDYIPISFWTESDRDYTGYWERTFQSLRDGTDILTGEDKMNMAIQFARSNPKFIQYVAINVGKKGSEFVSPGVTGAVDKKIRMRSDKSGTPNLETYDKITLNRQSKRAVGPKNGKFLPFIKYKNVVKNSNEKVIGKLSGDRLLALVDVTKDEEGNHLTGTYQEVQWLGGLNFNETDMSKINPVSMHPSNAGVSSEPSEGYYFQGEDEAYNKSFGISLKEADLEAIDESEVSEDVEREYNPDTGDSSKSEPTMYSMGTSMNLTEDVDQDARNDINKFLSDIGVSVEVVDSLDEKYDLPISAAANIANRTIEVADGDRKWEDLPEEAAHFYVEGLAGYKEMDTLIKRAKKDPLYQEVVEQYGEAYNYDEDRLARETAAKLIAKHLIAKKPIEKNWLRNILNNVKKFIEEFFMGKDPFAVAALNMREGNYAEALNTQISNDVMFAVKGVHPANLQDLKQESDIKLDMDKVGAHNKSRLKKLMSSIKADISRKKKGTFDVEQKNKLILLDSMLDMDQGLKFIDAYAKNAYGQARGVIRALDAKMANTEETEISKVTYLNKKLMNWLGSYDHITEIAAVLRNIYQEQNLDVNEGYRFQNILQAGELIKTAREEVFEAEKRLAAAEFAKYSVTNQSEQEIYDDFEFTVKDLSLLDFGIKSLSDTNDSLMANIARVIRIRMKVAENNFLKFLRGDIDNKGAAAATQEYLKETGTTNLDKLYDPFITHDKKEDRFKFLHEDKIDELTPSQQKFYKAVILPLIRHRRKLHAAGLRGIIGDPLNVPQIKKGTFESKSIDTLTESVKDTFRVVDSQDDYNRTDYAGNVLKSIPLRYQGGVPSSQVSKDLAQVIAKSMENLLFADSMSEVEQLTEVALSIMKRRRLVPVDSEGNPKPEETISPNAPLSVQKFEALRDAIFYGEKEIGYSKTLFGVADTRKLSDVARKTVSYSNLAFNFFAQIINPMVMGFFSLSKAVGGRDYTIKDWAKSAGSMFGNAAGMMADFNSKNPDSRQTLLMERLGIFSHGLEDTQLSAKGTLFKNFFTKLGYSGFKLGNAMVQPLSAEAYMRNKKITLKDGSEISMFDSYEKLDGRLVVKKEVLDAIGENEFAALEVEVSEMVRQISDNGGLSDVNYLQQQWWGKFVMMHRSWMGPMLENLYGSVRPDAITGKAKGGTWNTTFTLLRKGLSQENRYFLKAMWGHASLVNTGDLDPFTNKPFTKDSLDLYRSNTKQFIFHVATMVSLALMGALADDEKEMSKAQKMAKLVRLRFLAELASMINPQDIYRVLKHPTAAITYMDNIGKLLGHTINWSEASDVLEGGRYKGDTKFWANIKRLMPFEKQISKFEDIDSLIQFYE